MPTAVRTGRRRTVASVGVVTAFSVALVGMAFAYDGQATADVDLNDSGVWVTRGQEGELGRFNYESQTIDGKVVAGGAEIDLTQDAGRVLVADSAVSSASPVDVAHLELAGSVALPHDAMVVSGGSTVAVLDPGTGQLWVLPFDGIAAFDPEKTQTVSDAAKGGALAVSRGGTVFAAAPESGALLTVPTSSKGVPGEVKSRTLSVSKTAGVQVTAVGESPVVLDKERAKLLLPGGKSVDLGSDVGEARLQQPSAKSSNVVFATSEGLFTQPLSGGSMRKQAASGIPAAPVQLDGCTFGAWASTGQVIRDCPGSDNDIDRVLKGATTASALEYRVNRHSIVLNDLSAGTLWMAFDDYEKVDNWDQVLPEEAEGDESDAEKTTPEVQNNFIADRDQRNKPPVAKDDTFGARAGRTTVLPVLANDFDPDGDVITASADRVQIPNGTVQRILGGEALQVVVPPDATGRSSFVYTVEDGRGGEATARVALRIVPPSENAAPKQTSVPILTVAEGGKGSIKVLPYFRDPDGDDVFLAEAKSAVPGDVVRFHPDGTVEFQDAGGSTGRKVITLTVGDGRSTATGQLAVNVTGAENSAPVAVNDHEVVIAGEQITVEPLLNDSDPDGDPLRLATVTGQVPATVTPNYDAGTFVFKSNKVGSYDLTYTVTDGPHQTLGLVRVDVITPPNDPGTPIVVADTALLPAGGSTLVDVLANDTDPAGGVLVVQSVSVPEGAPIFVSVLEHRLLRITEAQRLEEPLVIEYTASNGTRSAAGQVRIVPVPAPTELQPPHAVEDEAIVHTGDIVNIDVLANDTHPDGLALMLQDTLEKGVDPAFGEAFVSDGVLRFRAGSKAGTAHATYRVRDKNGQEDSAQVTIHIRGGNENQPPQPKDVSARVLSGSSVRIPISLDGIDPDGDSVRLTGLVTAPTQGTVTIDGDVLVYRAFDDAHGLDSFTYAVADRRGQVATGSIRVGIAAAPATNQPPVAQDDLVLARPGRTVAVAALRNDSDPDGNPIGLVPSMLEDIDGLKPVVKEDKVVVQVPSKPGTYRMFYGVEDTFGARAQASITVQATADAPLLKPIARDDVVSDEDALGRKTVVVDVLKNDEDPDGDAADLRVTTAATTAVVGKGGALTVTLTPEAQVITYTVTDVDGLTAKAFVMVPALTSMSPALRPGMPPVQVASGEPLTLKLEDYVVVRSGRSPRLTEESKVTAARGSREVRDTTTIIYTSAPGYVGSASVTFEVTDGKSADDRDGRRSMLTIPIKVVPTSNQLPRLSSSTLTVAAGEEATASLAGLASDPDGDKLTFDARGAGGLTVKLTGTTLTVAAPATMAKGTVVSIPISVTDSKSPPVNGTITATVVGSTRPLPKANDDRVPDAHQGKAVSVDVTANDANPFPDSPLKVVGVPVIETGRGAPPTIKGNKVVVTPATDFHGVMVVRYTIADKTGDPDRQVDGRIHVTVLGRPEVPRTPTVEDVRSKTVVLTWDPPNNNGSPITGYTVRSQRGDVRQCRTTTCTIDGLTNNVEYAFTVEAENAVGTSDASAPSATVRPDQRPDAPAPPTLAFGDQTLDLRWSNTVYNDRSPIECVNIEISPAPPNGPARKECVVGTETTWTGLANGTGYRVRVQARNAAEQPSEFSGWSAAETPAGKPAAPAQPRAQRTALGQQSQMAVTWSAPADNGAAISKYTVQAVVAGNVVKSVVTAGPVTSYTMDVPANTTNYTFRVRAHNKATDKFGDAEFSAPSNEVRAFATPSAVTGLSATATGANGTVRLTFNPATAAGVNAAEMYYQYNAGGGWTNLSGNTATGLTNGSSYSIQVRAVAGVQGSDQPGPATTAGAVVPYGPPRVPGVAGATAGVGQTTTTVSWSDPGSNGRPYHVEIRVGGGGWEQVANSGSRQVGNGYGQSIAICARTVDHTDARTASSESCATARTGSAPALTMSVTKSPGGPCAGSDAACGYLVLHIRNAAANTSFRAQCWSNRNGDHMFSDWNGTLPEGGAMRTNGEGSFDARMYCYHGYAGSQVWAVTDAFGASARANW